MSQKIDDSILEKKDTEEVIRKNSLIANMYPSAYILPYVGNRGEGGVLQKLSLL